MFFAERLGPGHDLGRFRCGNATLDAWLADHALHAQRAGTARTYVWVDEAGEVVAYYALVPHTIERAQLPTKIGRGSPDVVPAVLLARLALAETLHGRGLGAELVADALGVALDAMARVGGRLVVVDAIDDAAAGFYVHLGFVPVPGDPHRLVMKASTAARALSLPWP